VRLRLDPRALGRVFAGRRRMPRGQIKGPIRPGPTAYTVCNPCTDAAQKAYEAMGPAGRAEAYPRGFRPRGWLKRDLARHLRDHHGMGATA